MKQTVYTYFILLFSLTFFSGCYRYIDWAATIVDQADKIETCIGLAKPYLKAARVYDQFTTLALFDALWLHEDVVDAYVCAHAAKYAFNDEQYHKFLDKQIEENEPYISFYLLATIYGPSGIMLTDVNPLWVVQLKVGDHYYNPAKIRLVELPHEYRYFFGKRWNIFKKPYLLQFDSYDQNNIPIVGPLTREVELVFRRVGHETSMLWCLDSQGRAIVTDSLDQDTMAYDINTNLF